MGVPAFFRWLSQKYPSIITDAVEEKKLDPEGNPLPVDTSTKNPNNFEFDNLYLDMNGIIHPCTHPEGGQPPPKDEEEMMQNVYDVIDRLYLIARPRKVLYLAVDGVAPRAKMNQQRSRRFRAAQEAEEKRAEEKKVREEAAANGHTLPEEKPGNGFDSNCITPGTEFMHKVARTLTKYAVERLASDPGFRDVKVIVSDASIPGEGEHKIMEFIRQQRAQPGYDPNTRHCICGLDADLIMLGLATHEPHFSVLREVVTFDRRSCRTCGREGHFAADCPKARGETVDGDDGPRPLTPYQFLHLYALREYLDIEYRGLAEVLPFPYDLERIVDDFVFMCFFVGNDFLPHSPTLEIREGAIELLMSLYKKILPSLDGYLTDNGEVNGERTKVLVKELSYLETGILQKRKIKEQRDAQRRAEQELRNAQQRERNQRPKVEDGKGGSSADANRNAAMALKRTRDSDFTSPPPSKRLETDHNKAATPNTVATPNTAVAPNTAAAPDTAATPANPTAATTSNTPNAPPNKKAAPAAPEDEVRLGDPGYRDRYYSMKFHSELSDVDAMRAICGSYIEGLAWVLRYYYQGCCSWKWYYPYHYAPFAADIAHYLGEIHPTFTKGSPFKPFEQLMGVLPPASAKCVPKPYRYVMGVADENEMVKQSPILHLYPTDFKLDRNGKVMLWQAVILLPFMEEEDLLHALSGLDEKLTDAEKNRNTLGEDMLFVNTNHPLAPILVMAQEQKPGESTPLSFDKGGMTGLVKKYDKLQNAHFGDIVDLFQTVVGAVFQNPPFPTGFIHESKLLEGLVPPPKVLEGADFRGGPGGMGSQDGGYHRMQNSAGMRMINHNLGFRADKGRGGGGGGGGRGYGLGTAPNFVRAGGPGMQQQQQQGMNPYAVPFVPGQPNYNNNNNYNNMGGPSQYNNGPNQYNMPPNYNNNYNGGGSGYNNNNNGGGSGYNNNYNNNGQPSYNGGGPGYNNNYNNNRNNNRNDYNNRSDYNRGGYNNAPSSYNNNPNDNYNNNNNNNNNNNHSSGYQASPYPNTFPPNYSPFAGRGGRR